MDLPPTALALPKSLPFPITVQRIHAPRGATVRKTQTLLTYSFTPPNADEQGRRERQVRAWESPVDGDLHSWAVREGDVVRDNRQEVVRIQEPCTHDVQLHGLCALCGKDLNATDYTGFSDTSRATISMTHDVGGLTVSMEEAHRLESATTSRLLGVKKLSLIVDLDQTIVHATVDPTVGEWLQDPKNPNFKALNGVGRFKLVDELPARKRTKSAKAAPPPAALGADEIDLAPETEDDDDGDEGCWYYVKMRPGLSDFLKRVASIYEMHVYTMGTRAYAKEVCKVIDPGGGLFGGRILSRDESGSMTRKSLQRLFPCDTNMVVIIDDRADVWDGSPNLVKVIPYEFFVGIGDINAAFLPKKKDLVPPPVVPSEPSTVPSADSPTSSGLEGAVDDIKDQGVDPEHVLPDSVASEPTTVSDLVVDSSPSEIVSPSLDEASTAAALTIHDVIEARPLEKAQREADSHHLHASASSEAEPRSAASVSAETTVEEEEEAVLKDDDTELERLFDILSTVHSKFFEDHASTGQADVASIIPSMKRQALRAAHIVFSGLVAIGTRPDDSEYWKLARTFGARCSVELGGGVTHLVANQPGTAKVHSARRRPNVKIVNPQWLLDSVAKWTHLSEAPYLLPMPESTTPPASPLRPPLSDGEGGFDDSEVADPARKPGEQRATGNVAAALLVDAESDDLELADVDWGSAMQEVDDLLNETDEEDATSIGGDLATDDADSDTGSLGSSSGRSRKRPRGSTSSESDGSAMPHDRGQVSAGAVESPLQKRVKTARSRKSGLKTSLSAGALDAARGDGQNGPDEEGRNPSSKKRPSLDESALPASSRASQISSSFDSDDDDLLASMVAEVEKGWN
ncbi:hypothetical protein JCM10207_000762 [Rhodosporidiobolus poonsookiae]